MHEAYGYMEPAPYRNEIPAAPKKKKSGGLVSAFFLYGGIIFGLAGYMLASVKHVTVEMPEKKVSFYTFSTQISDVLHEAGFTGSLGPVYTPNDISEGETKHYLTLSEDPGSRVRDGMVLKINQNSITKIPEERSVNPPVQRSWNIFMEPGQEKIMNQGQKGTIKDTWVAFYKNNILVYKYLQGSQLIKVPKPVIIASGSYEVTSREGAGNGHPLKFVATGYTHTGYRTAVGAKTRKGIIAVDPKVIPFGTRLYVQGYGYGVAADTGGMIKGKKIDLFFDSEQEAVNWGKRKVDIYILGK